MNLIDKEKVIVFKSATPYLDISDIVRRPVDLGSLIVS